MSTLILGLFWSLYLLLILAVEALLVKKGVNPVLFNSFLTKKGRK